MAKPSLQHAAVAYVVMDADNGEVLFASNADMGMVPASTLKVLTAATALELLGPNHRYATQVAYAGSVDAQGILRGDLIIRGEGDPSLGSDRMKSSEAETFLKQMLQVLRQKGVKRIDGNILADDLSFNGFQAPRGWTWQDMGNYFGAGVGAINWRENQFAISLKPGAQVGEPTQLLPVTGPMKELEILNEVLTGAKGTGDQVYAFAAPYAQKIFLRGTYGVDLQKKIQLAAPDGALYFAKEVKAFLEQNGLLVSGEAQTYFTLKSMQKTLPIPSSILWTYQSPAIAELVYHFNQKSINLYGESLLRTSYSHVEKKIPHDKVSEWMRDYWAHQTSIPAEAMRLYDGSGLSPENRITARALTQLMYTFKKKDWYAPFYESLPLINGMKMKSGTIGGVLTYTGYHSHSKGQSLIFTLMVNNYAGTASVMRPHLWQLLNHLK